MISIKGLLIKISLSAFYNLFKPILTIIGDRGKKKMNDETARKFIYQNARPLDIARWEYLFEGGSKNEVLKALTFYQNEDGGFGHALEPDCWNPNSAPVQTWVATQIIKEVELNDKNHPIIQGILRYLASGKDFNGHTWLNTIPTNDDYPHAPWWSYEENEAVSYNPTACLIGFIIKFADADSALYPLACRLTKEAYDYFKSSFPMASMHTVSCFVELYQYLKESSVSTLIDMEEFRVLLHKQIQHIMTYDTSKWAVEYVCKPSLFINDKTSEFYLENQEICDYECQFISHTQKEDGTWAITWTWEEDSQAWHISKNWWKSDWIIKNIKFVKAMK